jgi:thioredoxin-dependent peroxiredoxin
MSKIQIGDKLPSFKLLNQDGVEVDIVKFIGKPIVIYFYPKDNTHGCTREACMFRDEHHRFADAGVRVFGISGDSVKSHSEFKAKYKLPFDLLSDIGGSVRKLFGVPDDLFGLIPGRVTYIIDSKGFVLHMLNSQLDFSRHVDESLKILGLK